MTILVTRPHPDNETTLATLRQRRFEALAAPVLRFEPMPFHDDNADYEVMLGNGNGTFTYAPQLSHLRDPYTYCPS